MTDRLDKIRERHAKAYNIPKMPSVALSDIAYLLAKVERLQGELAEQECINVTGESRAVHFDPA